MNIIIVGCGKIGSTLAEKLNSEGHNITVIDVNEKAVREVAGELDVMGVTGNGAKLSVLRDAGIENADILIAVTDADELNMLSCLIAKKAGNVQTIARVRNPEYQDDIGYLKEELNLSMVVNPERIVAEEIIRLLRFPAARSIESFAGGKVDMLSVEVPKDSPLCNKTLKDLPKSLLSGIRICLLERGEESLIPNGGTCILPGDRISLIAPPQDAVGFLEEAKIRNRRVRSAFLVGGGTIAYYVAAQLEAEHDNCRLKVFELNTERCNFLAERFPKMTIINGDGAKKELLLQEGIEKTDSFLAITESDEENIVISLFASGISQGRLITKVTYMDPRDVPSEFVPGSVVSPKIVTAEQIVRFVRGMESSMDSNLEALYMVGDKAQACEFIVKDDPALTNIPIVRMNLKKSVSIAAIIRGNAILSPGGSSVLKPGDHVILLTTDTNIKKLSDILE